MLLIIATMVIGDHPRLFRRYRSAYLHLDTAFTDEESAREYVELRLGARVVNLSIKQVDLVNDTTSVEVRYVEQHRRGWPPRPAQRPSGVVV